MASETLPTTSYAVLGLLSWGPRSPYDLAALADRSIAHFWNIAKSQVYSETERLEELGYVKGTDVEQNGKPDKKILKLTNAGRKALDDWLIDGEIEPDKFRSAFLVKVMFGHRMPTGRLQEFLTDYSMSCGIGQEELQSIVETLPQVGELAFARATARLGLKITIAAKEWAQETLQELDTRSR